MVKLAALYRESIGEHAISAVCCYAWQTKKREVKVKQWKMKPIFKLGKHRGEMAK